jgi:hypothetical protein
MFLTLGSLLRAEIWFVDGKGGGLDFETAIRLAASGDTIRLLEGMFGADPEPYEEKLCGNCQDHRTPIRATCGFHIRGKALCIIGNGPESTTLVTNAGYGILFEDSRGSLLSDLRVTGGVRDSAEMATDAGVVLKRSTVRVERVVIEDNEDRADHPVGIAGIVGREGAELSVRDCIIRNNGWDGIALYRGAVASIADNIIEDGRGAGIGITWDAVATVLRNRISGYWKGIGTFGYSRAVVRNNAVFDNLGWGIIATGTSYLDASNNVVIRNGNCGVAVWSDDASGCFVNNIITENGWREEWVCPGVGVWVQGDASNFEIAFNNVWGNKSGDFQGGMVAEGSDGNISENPEFLDETDFHTSFVSPVRNAGTPLLTDPDGSRSDMGIYGGPSARP